MSIGIQSAQSISHKMTDKLEAFVAENLDEVDSRVETKKIEKKKSKRQKLKDRALKKKKLMKELLGQETETNNNQSKTFNLVAKVHINPECNLVCSNASIYFFNFQG